MLQSMLEQGQAKFIECTSDRGHVRRTSTCTEREWNEYWKPYFAKRTHPCGTKVPSLLLRVYSAEATPVAGGRMQVVLEYASARSTLYEDFLKRVQSGRHYKEEELLYLLEEVLQAIQELHSGGQAHEDFRMQNVVFVGKKYKKIRLAEQFCVAERQIAPAKLKKSVEELQCTQAHFAPESYTALQKDRNSKANILTYENDLWGVGIIFLELMLLESLRRQIYNSEKLRVNLRVLQQKLRRCRKVYLRASRIVELLTSINAEHRKNALPALQAQRIFLTPLQEQQQQQQEKHYKNQAEGCCYNQQKNTPISLNEALSMHNLLQKVCAEKRRRARFQQSCKTTPSDTVSTQYTDGAQSVAEKSFVQAEKLFSSSSFCTANALPLRNQPSSLVSACSRLRHLKDLVEHAIQRSRSTHVRAQLAKQRASNHALDEKLRDSRSLCASPSHSVASTACGAAAMSFMQLSPHVCQQPSQAVPTTPPSTTSSFVFHYKI